MRTKNKTQKYSSWKKKHRQYNKRDKKKPANSSKLKQTQANSSSNLVRRFGTSSCLFKSCVFGVAKKKTRFLDCFSVIFLLFFFLCALYIFFSFSAHTLAFFFVFLFFSFFLEVVLVTRLHQSARAHDNSETLVAWCVCVAGWRQILKGICIWAKNGLWAKNWLWAKKNR